MSHINILVFTKSDKMIQFKKANERARLKMRVGIVGSRNCKNFDASIIEEYLPSNCTEIISGGAVGIDSCAEKIAEKKGIPMRNFLPDYEKFGKRAPLERNLLIVRNSDMLLAFWDCYSRGTAHTINACIKENVPVRIIPIARKNEE